MARQRTINDAEFWRSPKISDCTQEDRATLLYLLTSPYSNIVGVYTIVPRIAAAEMGWTADQFLNAIKRQSQTALVAYDDVTCYVWVRIWWDHNSAKMAVASTLRQRTYEQIGEIPDQWRTEFLADLLGHLPLEQGLRDLVAQDMSERGYRVSIPYQYPIDRGPGNANPNNNNIFNTTTDAKTIGDAGEVALIFPNTSKSENLKLASIVSAAPEHLRQDILEEVEGKRRATELTSTPSRFAKYLVENAARFNLAVGLEVLATRERERYAVRSVWRTP